jgi:N-acetylglucosamine-6-sulfatase
VSVIIGNTVIPGVAFSRSIYRQFHQQHLEADGTISKEVMHDFLHLAPKGYDIWAESISAKVKETVEGK